MTKYADKFLNGYKLIYDPHNPSSMTCKSHNGFIYEHRKVMEEFLGRQLLSSEIVHHKDGNRSNNDISNLELTTSSDHCRTHKNGENFTKVSYCKVCGKTIKDDNRQQYCSIECTGLAFRRFEVTKEELLALINSRPYTEIGELFGVSGNAIKKRARKLGIILPDRLGYWTKRR